MGPGCTIAGKALVPGRTDHTSTVITVVGSGRTATTSADGTFELTNVTPGTYRVEFRNGLYEEVLSEVICIAGSRALVVSGQQLFTVPTLYLVRARQVVALPNDVQVSARVPEPSADQRGAVAWTRNQSGMVSGWLGTVDAAGTFKSLVDGATKSGSVTATPDWSTLVIDQAGSVVSVPSIGGAVQVLGTDVLTPLNDPRFKLVGGGRYVTYLTGSSDYPNSWIVPVTGGTPLGAAPVKRVHDCRVVPDGTRVFCRSTRATILKPLEGSAAVVTVPTIAHDEGADLSPDGSTVAFVATESGSTRLMIMPAAGGTATMLALAQAGPVAFAPDGKIFFVSPAAMLSWITQDGAQSGTIAPITYGGSFEFNATGTGWLVYNGGGATHAVALTSTTPIMLSSPIGTRLYSPDRRWLAVSNPNLGLTSLNFQTGQVTTLNAAGTARTISPDSAWIAYQANNSTVWISRLDGTSAREIGVSLNVAAVTKFSPDSAALMFSETAGVSVMPVAGSPTRVCHADDAVFATRQSSCVAIGWVSAGRFTIGRLLYTEPLVSASGIYTGTWP